MKHNYLRAAAITLIALPEPFTTPVGVALLIASFLLPKRHKDSLRNLEGIVRRYRSYTGKNRLGNIDRNSEPVVFHHLNRGLLSLRENIIRDAIATPKSYLRTLPRVQTGYDRNYHPTKCYVHYEKKAPIQSQYNHLTDSRRVSDKIIHHVLRTSLSLYEAIPEKREKIIYHTIRTTLQPPISVVSYSGLQPIGSVTKPVKIVYHSFNRF
jgi:hypothetical protein